MNHKFFIILLSLFSCVMVKSEVLERALPTKVEGVKAPSILLNGAWDFQFNADSKWRPIQVPGEIAMQGYALEHDKAVTYKKKVAIPADYRNKKVILRFDGVYSYTRLWVNGTYVCDHHGGFTRWEADITSLAKVGKLNEIKLEVTDRKDEISYASAYAHHPIGGILRDVTVYALPKANLADFFVETVMDSLYNNACLKITYRNLDEKIDGVEFTLRDPLQQTVLLNELSIYNNEDGTKTHEFDVTQPMKWDAEHPNLYTLQVKVKQNGKYTYSFTRKVGFREVKIVGNQMFVNGKQVKLRGACRHDIHPTLGRTTTNELDSLDALIFKQTNMNFVRTSHYPPTEKFLEYCDKMGIYVECETAICFVNTHRQKNYAPGASHNDSLFTGRYLNQLKEMVKAYRSHASIIFWSIGNESTYGINFQSSYDWVKATDKTRPAIFSYPGTVEKGKKVYDLMSFHYPGVEGTMEQFGMSCNKFQVDNYPSIFDEWAHVPCYTYSSLQNDPNIRDFWGRSLDMMWANLFESKGGLGGAIWGYIDETFMIKKPKIGKPYWIEFARTSKPKEYQGDCVGYGEWGVVDIWRREKPEFWGTKKAYSPIRLLQTEVTDFTFNQSLNLPIYNRFDHTNLNEVKAFYTFKGEKKVLDMPNVLPHKKGILAFPANEWANGNEVIVEFIANNGLLIDAYTILLGKKQEVIGDEKGNIMVDESANVLTIKGDDFVIPFDKTTGSINNAISHGQVVIEKGPFLNLDLNVNHKTGPEVREKAQNYTVDDKDWQMKSFSCIKSNNRVVVTVNGTYKCIAFEMNIQIASDGKMEINYKTQNEPNGWLREAGLKFYLSQQFTKLNWERKGYWSYYPEGSFASNRGEALLYNPKKVAFGDNPNQSWNVDTHNYYYFANAGADSKIPLTNIAKGMKENVASYILKSDSGKGSVSVLSNDNGVSCRLNKGIDEQLMLYIDNRWDYPEIGWGDYCKALDVTPCFGKIIIKL